MRESVATFFRLLQISTFVTLASCAKIEKPTIQVQELGTFDVNRIGHYLNAGFRLKEGASTPHLGCTIQGIINGQLDDNQVVYVKTNLWKLRFRLQLFQENATNDFYNATFNLAKNYNYHPWRRPDFSFIICGIEPFPYCLSETRRNVVALYRYGRDVYPVRGGQLVPNIGYSLRLEVLEPCALTNRLQLWLYMPVTH